MSDTTDVQERKKPGPKPKVHLMEGNTIVGETPDGIFVAPTEKPQAKPSADRTPIPVRVLHMRHGQGLDFPGRAGESSCTSKPENFKTTTAHWVIEYLPWMRHHRVTFHPAGGEKSVVRMFHEAYVSWEPL